MRIVFFIGFFISLISCNRIDNVNKIAFADNMVVAHRGAWNAQDIPQNSISSLKRAISLNCRGSEFDVRMTADNVLILCHDSIVEGLVIEETIYNELSGLELSNGESLPTLKEYLLFGIQNSDSTGLVCEIKPSRTKERGKEIAEKVLELVNEMNAEKIISSYISFDYDILKAIIEIDPESKTQYLNGDKSPIEIASDGITGIDYEIGVFREHNEWIEEAKTNNLSLNAWTVNDSDDIDWLLANGFDCITTDVPELVFERIRKAPSQNGWNLVWSDEFNTSGKPDSTKWQFEYGLVRNNEQQYYTDKLRNSRVEDGKLLIETHKEAIYNAQYRGSDLPAWKRDTEYAPYSSASLTTKDLGEWMYGLIEVRAKLPEGRGLWPAIWMLSENWKEVGWPECGEIDIMEHVGFDQDSIFGTIHTKAFNHIKGTQKGKKIYLENPYSSYHIFAIEWDHSKIDFLMDNKIYYSVMNEYDTTEEWPFDQHFHLKLNTAVGGGLGGMKGIDDSAFPQVFIIDFVRVYQRK